MMPITAVVLAELASPSPDADFCGYIAPNGTCYACRSLEHSKLAAILCDSLGFLDDGIAPANVQERLENEGFIRIERLGTPFDLYDDGVSWNVRQHVPTKRQIDVLLQIGRYSDTVERNIGNSKLAARMNLHRKAYAQRANAAHND